MPDHEEKLRRCCRLAPSPKLVHIQCNAHIIQYRRWTVNPSQAASFPLIHLLRAQFSWGQYSCLDCAIGIYSVASPLTCPTDIPKIFPVGLSVYSIFFFGCAYAARCTSSQDQSGRGHHLCTSLFAMSDSYLPCVFIRRFTIISRLSIIRRFSYPSPERSFPSSVKVFNLFSPTFFHHVSGVSS